LSGITLYSIKDRGAILEKVLFHTYPFNFVNSMEVIHVSTKISLLGKKTLHDLRSLSDGFQYCPYRNYRLEGHKFENHIIEDISDVLSNKDNFALAANSHNKFVGIISLEQLEWDTNYFGIKMARIPHLIVHRKYPQQFELRRQLITRLMLECSARNIEHISARIAKEDIHSIHALESQGFRLMDLIVTGFVNTKKWVSPETNPKWPVREFSPHELPILVKIANEAFIKGRIASQRFHNDPLLPKDKSDKLYVQWLINASKGLADTILVAEINNKPVGFCACKVERELSERIGLRLGVIFLTGVLPSARGKGVHSSMLEYALNWFSNKVDVVEIGAEVSNYAAQRGWRNYGFKIVRSQCTFHKSLQAGEKIGDEMI
jgi:ribosomal protein S18 acetylase RimI-like enzyme